MKVERNQADALAQRLTAVRGRHKATLDAIETLRTANEAESQPLEVDPRRHAAELLARHAGPQLEPIGIWRPYCDGDLIDWRRDDEAPNNAWWSPARTLAPKNALLPLRLCLLGESTAAGWFHAPAMTPARMLTHQLDGLRGEGLFEVIDLTMVNLQPATLVELAAAALQLSPDVLVVFAGNNWPMRLPSFPRVTLDDTREAAAVFARGGATGLAEIARARTLTSARNTLDTLGHVAEAAGIPLVLVVPEVNLGDWIRRRPVPWLPSDRSQRWHAGLDRARTLLHVGDARSALDEAHAMHSLDNGICATTHEVIARAHEQLGDLQAANAAWRESVSARTWDNFPSMPSTPPDLQDLMRTCGAAHGFSVVDLPRLFAQHAGQGRELFLDYCHLTLEGMRIAMAGVAAEVLTIAGPTDTPHVDVSNILSRVPEPHVPPEDVSRAMFMSALYNAHHAPGDAPLDNGDAVCRHWLKSSLDTYPDVTATMRAYVAARAQAPMSFHVSAEQQRFHGALGDLERQSAHTPGVDPDLVGHLHELLGEADAFADALCAHHVGSGIDLTHPYYHWRLCERFEGGCGFGQAASGFLTARWACSDFCLIAEGGQSLVLDMTARLPDIGGERIGEVAIECNGAQIERASLSTRWQRVRVRVPCRVLQRGINRLRLAWPALPAAGDDALSTILTRLEEGIPVDLHPVFGELFRLRVSPVVRG